MTQLNKVLLDLGVSTNHIPQGPTSLNRVLHNAKHSNVAKYFGSSFDNQVNDKYSESHTFTVCGNIVTLYMADGVWRFGTAWTTVEMEADLNFIELLLNN